MISFSEILSCEGSNIKALVNPLDKTEWCFVFDGADNCENAELLFKRKPSIKYTEIPNLEVLVGASPGRLSNEEVFEQTNNPMCVESVGSVMCAEGSTCVVAMNVDAPDYRNNKRVYDAIRQYTFTGWQKFTSGTAGGLAKFFTGSSTAENYVGNFGLCITDAANPWDAIKGFFANLFGLDPDNPAVTVIVVVFFILLLLLIFYLTQPKQGKQNINVGGGGYY